MTALIDFTMLGATLIGFWLCYRWGHLNGYRMGVHNGVRAGEKIGHDRGFADACSMSIAERTAHMEKRLVEEGAMTREEIDKEEREWEDAEKNRT